MNDDIAHGIVQSNELVLMIVLVSLRDHAVAAHVVVNTVETLEANAANRSATDVAVRWVESTRSRVSAHLLLLGS